MKKNKDNILVCGVDEAGRGPLAGAVYAAAVILNAKRPISGLADSKVLTEKERVRLTAEIKEHALAWAISSADVDEIDRINILQASLLAMRRAIEGLSIVPAEALIDGLHCPDSTIPCHAIVRGDETVAEISAASILAKTARDEEMVRLHQLYPEYGFDQHKGYATALHLEALRCNGACEIHRKSFAPVKLALERKG